MTLIIVIIVLALLVLWVISVQRKLVNQDELCKNSMSTIGVQQESRWDALTGMVELIKSYNEHEYNTLRDVIAQRRPIDGNSSAEEADQQENLMGQVASRLNVVIEQYPDIKANENYAKAMDAVDKYTNMVRTSKMVYNDTATNYNKLIRQIPDSFVASLFGFKVREYLKIEDQKTGMPSLKI
ncbi:MAG: LemA family protein [Bacteroidales bacterium]|jgi:LemA protein|nr:LemA family protein [Bacteroidales bacterium]MDY6418536.1 LemA family protein [Bacteroidales bacterium]